MKLISLFIFALFFTTGMLLYTIYNPYEKNSFIEQVITGLIALVLMLFMHVYSLRKKFYDWFIFKKIELSLSQFLDIHIVMGTLGFILILFHSKFSFNNFVAWFATLILFVVFVSGFLGKFVYAKIPRSLNGKEKKRGEMLNDLDNKKNDFFLNALSQTSEETKIYFTNLISHFDNGLEKLNEQGNKHNFLFTELFYLLKINIYINKYIKIRQNKVLLENKTNQEISNIQKQFKILLFLNFHIVFLKQLKRTLQHWHNFHVPLTIIFYTMVFFHSIVILIFNYSKIFK